VKRIKYSFLKVVASEIEKGRSIISITNKVSLAQFWDNSNIHANFHTPISQQANLELQQLHRIIEHIQMNTQGKDVWSYIWCTNNYASKKYYSLNFKSIEVSKPFQWIWKSKVTKKLKIFIWLAFKYRINSRNILKRKNYRIEDDYNCVLCNLNIEEYTYHLIFQCPFSARCWNYLGIH
jgi:hypothetical protein